MKEIAFQDIQGFRIGSAQDEQGGTGCTVLIFPDGAPCGVDIRGGGPASRESELLNPTAAAERTGILMVRSQASTMEAQSKTAWFCPAPSLVMNLPAPWWDGTQEKSKIVLVNF